MRQCSCRSTTSTESRRQCSYRCTTESSGGVRVPSLIVADGVAIGVQKPSLIVVEDFAGLSSPIAVPSLIVVHVDDEL